MSSIVKNKNSRKVVVNVKPAKARKAKKNTSSRGLTRVGENIGSYFGPVGRMIGRAAGAALGSITGSGGYRVRGNTLMTNNSVPSFTSTSEGMRIRHREYMLDLTPSVDFKNHDFYLNPGNSTIFPWLSGVANSFETYEFHGLMVCYNPTSATAITSSNPSQGTVIFSTNYDVLNPKFVSKSEAEAYEFTTSTVPYEGMLHPVECKLSETPLPMKYVTSAIGPSQLAGDDDPRLHFHGLLQLMTVGQQATSTSGLGEVWVSYDVSLRTPKQPQIHAASDVASVVGFTNNSTGRFVADNVKPYLSAQANYISFTPENSLLFSRSYFTTTRPGLYFACTYALNSSSGTTLSFGGDWGFTPGGAAIKQVCSPGVTSLALIPDVSLSSLAIEGVQFRSSMYSVFLKSPQTVSVASPWNILCPNYSSSAPTSQGVIAFVIRLGDIPPLVSSPDFSMNLWGSGKVTDELVRVKELLSSMQRQLADKPEHDEKFPPPPVLRRQTAYTVDSLSEAYTSSSSSSSALNESEYEVIAKSVAERLQKKTMT